MTVDAFRALDPTNEALSPSLRTAENGSAYELKFVLDPEAADRIEGWARQRLLPDPHGRDGMYRTTSLYCDTPALDVFHRSPGFRRNKYRVRRYGEAGEVHLERKTKKGDRVRKRRNAIPLDNLNLVAGADPEAEHAWSWFVRQVRFRGLKPACRVGYDRTAFLGKAGDDPVRLTLDRNLIGVPAQGWELPSLAEGRSLLDEVILELKFHTVLPALFRDLLAKLPNAGGGGKGSKYRLCMKGWGLAGGAT